MSAAGFTPIQLYRTTTASAVPSAGNLADGELAINLTDEALYFKNASGVVTLLADSSGALGSVTSVNASGGTTGLTFSGGPITSSGTLTLGGTLAVANGGTGVTTSTGTGSVVLATSPTLTTPNLGTPSAVTLTNATGLPLTTGVTGTLPVANGGTGVTTSTGTGSVVLSNSPTLVTPTLGVASATSIATGKGTVGSVAYGFVADTDTGMWSPAADTLAFSTGGNRRLTVDSAGLVGIGTSTPTSNLHVNSFGNTILRISTSFTNSATTGIVVDQPGDSSQARIQYLKSGVSQGLFRFVHGATVSDQGFDLNISNVNTLEVRYNQTVFRTGTSERMRIDSSGNVGIGTTAPANRLAVQNDTAPTFFDTTLDNTAFLICNRGAGDGNFGASLGFSRLDSVGRVNAAIAIKQTSADADQCGMSFFTHASAATGVALQESMTITHAGNVGIGTSSPGARLHLENPGSTVAVRLGTTASNQYLDIFRESSTGFSVYNAAQADPFRAHIWQLGGAEAMRINSAGNVGIGLTGPQLPLSIGKGGGAPPATSGSTQSSGGIARLGSSGAATLDVGTLSSGSAWLQATNVTNLASNFDMLLNPNGGNVGIGTSSPSQRLRVVGTSGTAQFGAGTSGNAVFVNAFDSASIFMTASATNSTSFGFGSASNIPLFFMTNNNERARIDTNGNLLVGTTTNTDGGVLVVNQDASASNVGISTVTASTGTRFHILFRNGNGQVGSISTSGTATTYSTSSDARLKHDIVDAPDAADLIDAIKVRSFKWNADNSEQRYGFVAQELLEVAPEAVGGAPDGDEMMGVDYSKLVPMLVKEVQSLRARVAQLETSAATLTFEGN